MEKLSERIDTLKPRSSQKLKADLVDILIYSVTLLSLINILFPIFNKGDYNLYKAIITGSLFFVIINYFLRYYIPSKTNGKTIGKLLFKLQTVDYYGYEVKSSQLIMKESIYIFLPILFFSKSTMMNYFLIGLWFLVFLKSVYNAYFQQNISYKSTLKEAKELLMDSLNVADQPQKIELTNDQMDSIGLLLFDKIKELKTDFKINYKNLKNTHNEEFKALKTSQKEESSAINKEDKDAVYQLSIQHKLQKDTLSDKQNKELNEKNIEFDNSVNTTRTQELDKAQAFINSCKEDEPNYVPISRFVNEVFPQFLGEFFEALSTPLPEEADKTYNPFEALENRFNIDKLPRQLINAGNVYLNTIKLHRTIEDDNGYIVDIEYQYTKDVVIKVSKTIEETVIDKKTNEEKLVTKKIKEEQTVPKIWFRTKTTYVSCITNEEDFTLQFNRPKLHGIVARRFNLHRKANANQSRSVMDIRANTITVDQAKFKIFYETHRSEE